MGLSFRNRGSDGGGGGGESEQAAPGRRTLTGAVQLKKGAGAADAQAIAADGVAGGGGALPHGDIIQAAFGSHDVRGISAHVGGAAAEASNALGAQAYATGSSVAFREAPDLHTAAHEAAHVVQQQAGVHLAGGVGQEGDAYERHADAVADAVVRGESAEGLLSAGAGGGGGGAGVQRQVQRHVQRHVQRKITRPEPVLQLKGDPQPLAEGMTVVPEGKKGAKVAKLHMLIDVDVKEMTIKDLKSGNVGHAWISIEYNDPHAVPDDVDAGHKALLKTGGRYADPMGFWPDTANGVHYNPNPFKSWVQGWMRHPDRAHQGREKAMQSWDITQDEVDAVIAYAESKKGEKYSVYFFNCTTFAKEAVQAAGKSPPSSSAGGICFPNAAYDGIIARQNAKKGDTMVKDFDTGAETTVDGADEKKG